MAVVSVVLFVILSLVAVVDPIVGSDSGKACTDCEVKIPLEMALRLNTITDENQLFRDFINNDGVEPPILKAQVPLNFASDSVADRFGESEDGPIERKAVSKPKPAGCIPELRSVSLRQTEDPWIYYWPSCTRVEQCGGCCSHQLLSCQPIEVEELNFQVFVTEYEGNMLKLKGKEIVTVEKHTKCKCDCITKKEDCNPLQEYRKGECRCLCTNRDAEVKCNAENETKHWNPENCTCECHKVYECSTGTYFSQETCGCEQIPDESQLIQFASNSADNSTSFQRQPPSRRRWPPAYSFGNGK